MPNIQTQLFSFLQLVLDLLGLLSDPTDETDYEHEFNNFKESVYVIKLEREAKGAMEDQADSIIILNIKCIMNKLMYIL